MRTHRATHPRKQLLLFCRLLVFVDLNSRLSRPTCKPCSPTKACADLLLLFSSFLSSAASTTKSSLSNPHSFTPTLFTFSSPQLNFPKSHQTLHHAHHHQDSSFRRLHRSCRCARPSHPRCRCVSWVSRTNLGCTRRRHSTDALTCSNSAVCPVPASPDVAAGVLAVVQFEEVAT